jgi:hypothetical protein
MDKFSTEQAHLKNRFAILEGVASPRLRCFAALL